MPMTWPVSGLAALLHMENGMKPLIDMTAKNDDTLDLAVQASVERARRREARERRLKGPTWAMATREVQVA
jgi:hypothetical protein